MCVCMYHWSVLCADFIYTYTHTHFTSSAEAANATNRIIFLTDLQSTCDSVNDEKRLLSTIRSNADAGVYTTVVGIGMVCMYILYVCVYACYGKALQGCYVCCLFGWLRMWYSATRGCHCVCMSVPVPMLLKPLSQFV